MLDGRTSELKAADLDRLVTNQIPEGPELEYKRDLPGHADAAHREFLADVSSFANSRGGTILYGIDERKGVATEVCGLPGVDPDAERLRLESLLADCVKPRIPGLTTHAITATNGHPVVVVHCPQSWTRPHVVDHKGHWRFYARISTRKVRLDVGDVRSLVGMSESLREQVRAFRMDRLARVVSGETPIPLRDGAKIVLHVVPIQSFTPEASVNLELVTNPPLQPLGSMASSGRRNFDGHVRYYPGSEFDEPSYVQVFRNGCIEAVNCGILAVHTPYPWPVIPGLTFERELIEATSAYLDLLTRCEVSAPILIMLSLLGVRGYHVMTEARSSLQGVEQPIDRADLILPDVLLEQYPEDVSRSLRPVFDIVWNAGGFKGSPFYDSADNRKEPPG